MSFAIFNPDKMPTAYYVADYISCGQHTGNLLQLPMCANSDWKIQLKFQMQAYGGGAFFGYCGNDDSGIQYRFFGYSGQWYFDLNSISYRLCGGTISTDTIYNFEMANRYVKNLDTGNYILGSASTSKAPSFSSEAQLQLFGEDGYGKCYSIKAYMNNVLKYDFVPAINTRGLVGLYDKVNSKFYGRGTGLKVGQLTGEIIYE